MGVVKEKKDMIHRKLLKNIGRDLLQWQVFLMTLFGSLFP